VRLGTGVLLREALAARSGFGSSLVEFYFDAESLGRWTKSLQEFRAKSFGESPRSLRGASICSFS